MYYYFIHFNLKSIAHTDADTVMNILEVQSKKDSYICTYLVFQASAQT